MINRITLLFLFLSLGLSGCFELVEEVTLHADGSGTYSFEMNLSQSKTKLAAVMALDSMDGVKIPSRQTIDAEIVKATKLLAISEGISRVETKKDFDNFIFSIRFDFKSLNSMNEALKKLQSNYAKGRTAEGRNGFTFHGKSFERVNDYKPKDELKKVPPKDLELFNAASMTCIYRFDQGIHSFSNSDARLSKNGKALFLKVSILDLLKGVKNISDKIELN